MHFKQETTSDGIVLVLDGSFTFKDHHSFRTMLDLLKTSAGSEHVLDMSGVEFLDSAALGMLLVADEEAKSAGWTLTLRRPSSQLARLMELAALDTVFSVEK